MASDKPQAERSWQFDLQAAKSHWQPRGKCFPARLRCSSAVPGKNWTFMRRSPEWCNSSTPRLLRFRIDPSTRLRLALGLQQLQQPREAVVRQRQLGLAQLHLSQASQNRKQPQAPDMGDRTSRQRNPSPRNGERRKKKRTEINLARAPGLFAREKWRENFPGAVERPQHPCVDEKLWSACTI